jgi:hypothetical protein
VVQINGAVLSIACPPHWSNIAGMVLYMRDDSRFLCAFLNSGNHQSGLCTKLFVEAITLVSKIKTITVTMTEWAILLDTHTD